MLWISIYYWNPHAKIIGDERENLLKFIIYSTQNTIAYILSLNLENFEHFSSQKDLNVPFAGTNGFGSILPSYDHLNNVNPRTMRRIINSMALTGRLLRIFDIQFSWIFLFSWISLIEQWPLRMSWLIDVACGHQVFINLMNSIQIWYLIANYHEQ